MFLSNVSKYKGYRKENILLQNAYKILAVSQNDLCCTYDTKNDGKQPLSKITPFERHGTFRTHSIQGVWTYSTISGGRAKTLTCRAVPNS